MGIEDDILQIRNDTFQLKQTANLLYDLYKELNEKIDLLIIRKKQEARK
jgi:hypothetical protein